MSVSSLAQRWQSIARIPAEYSRDPETRYRYLLACQQEAQQAIAGIDRSGYTTAQALKSEPDLNRKVSAGAPYWAGASISAYLNVDLGLKVDTRTFRDWVLLQYDKAAAGVPYLHPDMRARMVASGHVEECWILDDWQRRCRTFKALARAGQEGAYGPIREGAIAGLGAAQVAGVPVAVFVMVLVVVLVIAAVAYIVTEAVKTSQMNQHYQGVIDRICYDKAGNFISSPECLKAVDNAMDKNRDKTHMQQMLEQGLKYGALALGGYLVVSLIINRQKGDSGTDVVIQTGK